MAEDLPEAPWAKAETSLPEAPWATQKKPFSWSEALGNTWPGRLAKAAYDTATLPGDVYAGRAVVPSSQGQVPGSVDPLDPRGVQTQERIDEAKWLMSPATPTAGVMRFARKGVAPQPTEIGANRALADEFGVPLSGGQAGRDLEATRYEDLAARGAYGKPAQDVAAPFFEGQFQDIGSAGSDIGRQLARDAQTVESPSHAAGVVNSELGSTAQAYRDATAQAQAQFEREAQAQRAASEARGAALEDTLRQGRPAIEAPRDAGEIVRQDVRDAAVASRQNYQRLYNEAHALPGQFESQAFTGVGNRIQHRLSSGNEPIIIDDITTPAASRAVRDLDNISNLRIQNRADPHGAPNPADIVAVDLRGVDQARKRLVAQYRAARSGNNGADVRAISGVIDAFDAEVEGAVANGLFSGDERALGALRQARAAYGQYARTFRPQFSGDDVGLAMRRIIDRNATPEEVANMIAGSGRVGNAGLPVRMADRLEQVLGADSEGWNSIRQAIWQRAAQPRNAAGAIDQARSSQGILQLANSSLGRRMFSDVERAAMQTHANGVRNLDQLIENLPSRARAERMANAYERVFGGEEIGGVPGTAFRRILEGTATNEETAQAVFSAIGGGNPGNVSRLIRAVEAITGRDSEAMGAIRQGVWQKLTQNAAGKDQPGQQKLSQAINEFLNGKGKTIAEQLYTPQELNLMRRYANVVKMTVIPKYARTNSDTTPALMSVLHKYGSAIAAAIGTAADSVTGGLAGYAVNSLIQKGAGVVKDTKAASRVAKSLAGEPKKPLRITVRPLPFIRGTGALNGPSNVAGPLGALQSPGIGRAEDNENGVPRPERQQKHGGAVGEQQHFAHGGKVTGLAGRRLAHKFAL
jgi:hypothetical protein